MQICECLCLEKTYDDNYQINNLRKYLRSYLQTTSRKCVIRRISLVNKCIIYLSLQKDRLIIVLWLFHQIIRRFQNVEMFCIFLTEWPCILGMDWNMCVYVWCLCQFANDLCHSNRYKLFSSYSQNESHIEKFITFRDTSRHFWKVFFLTTNRSNWFHAFWYKIRNKRVWFFAIIFYLPFASWLNLFVVAFFSVWRFVYNFSLKLFLIFKFINSYE